MSGSGTQVTVREASVPTFISHFPLVRSYYTPNQGPTHGWGAVDCSTPPPNGHFKNTDFVGSKMLKFVRDLLFSHNQPLKCYVTVILTI